MHHISAVLPKVVEHLEQPTKNELDNTQELVKCDQFQTLRDPQLEGMKEAAEQFVNDMLGKKASRWLSFLGSSGAGKTMLAKWISSVFKDRLDWEINWPATELTRTAAQPYGRIIRHRGDYRTWGSVAKLLRDGEFRLFDDICGVGFLVVDDIGAEHGSDFISSKLYELCSRREGKWTVFTGNLSLSDIEARLDARIASRMIRNGSIVIDVDVPDFNLRVPPTTPA